jgi:hypothetical protein
MNFGRKIHAVAWWQYAKGKITKPQYEQVVMAVKNHKVLSKWQSEVEKNVGAPWKQGIDLNSIWDWLVKNLPQILAILAMVLPLFMEKGNEEHKKSDS